MPKHEDKEYKGKHRDPRNIRRKPYQEGDPQIYDNGLAEAQKAAEEDNRRS